jgi:TusA-related sulfurtransferase
MISNDTRTAEAGAPEPAARIELLSAGAAACAILTPAIKAALQRLEPGQVLLARVDDPVARLDVAAWCALTGHTLLATTEEAGGVLGFYIRKESKR